MVAGTGGKCGLVLAQTGISTKEVSARTRLMLRWPREIIVRFRRRRSPLRDGQNSQSMQRWKGKFSDELMLAWWRWPDLMTEYVPGVPGGRIF